MTTRQATSRIGGRTKKRLSPEERKAYEEYEQQLREAKDKLLFQIDFAKVQARFRKMTPAEKRVEVAKDVLAQLRSQRIVARQGL